MTKDLDLLTSQEVADLLRVPIGTVYHWRATKSGPKGAQVGKRVLYNRCDVLAWWNHRVAMDRSSQRRPARQHEEHDKAPP